MEKEARTNTPSTSVMINTSKPFEMVEGVVLEIREYKPNKFVLLIQDSVEAKEYRVCPKRANKLATVSFKDNVRVLYQEIESNGSTVRILDKIEKIV